MGANAAKLSNLLGAGSVDCHDISAKRKANKESYLNGISTAKVNLSNFQEKCQNIFPCDNLILLARKRPLNEKEKEKGEFDVISCISSNKENDVMWVHKCELRLNMKQMYIEHHGYSFGKVFSELNSSDDVFREGILPKLDKLNKGGDVCIMAYGATGSGKSFSMTQISSKIVNYILPLASSISINCYEIVRDTVFDMLFPEPEEAFLVVDNVDGETVVLGHRTPVMINNMNEFEAIWTRISLLRQTRATGVHNCSSRSHLIVKLTVTIAGNIQSNVYLVDLAGSEWARDQVIHDASLIEDSKFINSSLMSLKQCLQWKFITHTNTSKSPDLESSSSAACGYFRDNKLTRVLKSCIMSPNSTIIVLATVSPGSSDTEHTMATLSNMKQPFKVEKVGNMGVSSISGDFVMSSNIEGVARLNFDEDVEIVNENILDSVKDDVRSWSSRRVCEWFTNEMNQIALQSAELVTNESLLKNLVNVELSAKRWMQARFDSTDSIGLAFDTDDSTEFMKVSKVMKKGYFLMVKGGKVCPGDLLVKINGVQWDSKEKYMSVLKAELKRFKENIEEWRKYDNDCKKFMTKDMEILRKYILNGPTCVSKVDNENHLIESNNALNSVEETNDRNAVSPPDNVEETNDRNAISPAELILSLSFAKAMSTASNFVLPSVPKVFSGESRTGEVWTGKELVEKYFLQGPSRFITTCNGNVEFGMKMFEALKKEVEK